MRLRWLEPDRRGGVTVDQVTDATGSRTALIVLSDVAYRSGYLADVAAITAMAHDHGALVLWDVCHSAGVIPRRLDDWQVDLAVGCTYKYLNGGPGSPAFGYVRADLQKRLRQPIQGWMGSAEPFAMAAHYTPSDGIRRFLSGTPSIIAMLAMQDMLALIEEAGLEAIRAKSVALTEFAIQVSERCSARWAYRWDHLATRHCAGATSRWSILSSASPQHGFGSWVSFPTSGRRTDSGSAFRR